MVMGHGDAVAYQSSQLTGRLGRDVLDDLAALDVSGSSVAERGETYLLFAPDRRRAYTPAMAVAVSIVVTLLVLILTAYSVAFVVALPIALLPFIPLLRDDRPQLAVGAVPDEPGGSATRITVHGRVWADLGPALDAYLGNLPAPQPAPPAGRLAVVGSSAAPWSPDDGAAPPASPDATVVEDGRST